MALNYSMSAHGGFEGNGQTLRIASKLGEYSPEDGLDLTRRTLLGVLKYPGCYSKVVNRDCYSNQTSSSPINIERWKPPKCIFDDEEDVLEWILKPFSFEDKRRFQDVKVKNKKHCKPKYKSFDASIMELADDIAYGVHDLEDALALCLVKFKEWDEEVISKIAGLDYCEIKQDIDFYNQKLFSDSNKDRKHAVSKLVRFFITNTKIVEQKRFKHFLLDYEATIETPGKEILDILKHFVHEHVIKKPEVQALEYKGQQMVLKLFEVLQENPRRLLPKTTLEKYEEASNKNRIMCDYVSGMTDSYATKLYHRLFSPDIGSIFDRL